MKCFLSGIPCLDSAIEWLTFYSIFSFFFFIKVPGHWGTNHRALPPHLPRHGQRGDVPASQRPQPWQQRPVLAVELRCHAAAGGSVGGVSVQRPGAAWEVPRTHLCARALVLLHVTHKEKQLVDISSSRESVYLCVLRGFLDAPLFSTFPASLRLHSQRQSIRMQHRPYYIRNPQASGVYLEVLFFSAVRQTPTCWSWEDC